MSPQPTPDPAIAWIDGEIARRLRDRHDLLRQAGARRIEPIAASDRVFPAPSVTVCPACRASGRVSQDQLGSRIACPAWCGAELRVNPFLSVGPTAGA